MIPLWCFLLIIIAMSLYRFYDKDRKYWLFQNIPCPGSPLLFGQYWSLKLPYKQSILQLQKWTNEFGQFYGILEGSRKILVISNLDMIHELLVTKFDIFETRKLNAMADEKSSFNEGSILHSTSFRWKRLRNIASTYFNAINVKKTIPTIQKLSNKYAEHLGSYASNDMVFDIVPLLQQLTDDIFAHLIFGDEQAADQDYLNKMFDAIDAKKNRIEKVFSIICTIFPFLKPIVHWMNSKLKTNYFFNNQLYKNIAEKIERRKKELKSQKKGTNNQNFTYLDHLLTTELLGRDEEREEEREYFYSGRQVTRYLMTNEIVSAMMNMLYAGHKTSARALIAVVYSLAKNPAVQKKVFDEEVSNLNEDLTFEMLERLTYLDLVIREALRLFPLGSEHVARKCMASTTLGGEVKLEIGNFVMVDVMSLHFNENLWGPEPEKFNPDRWLNLQYKNSTQYLSFGQGPRMCLGEKLAMLKLKIMLVVLLKNFRIIAVDEEVYLKDQYSESTMKKLYIRKVHEKWSIFCFYDML